MKRGTDINKACYILSVPIANIVRGVQLSANKMEYNRFCLWNGW